MIPRTPTMMRVSSAAGIRIRGIHSATSQVPSNPQVSSTTTTVVAIDEAVRNQQQQQQQQSSIAMKDFQAMKGDQDPMVFQQSLGARAEQINRALLELQPKLAALKDPVARKEVELHVRDLARRGHLISEAKRKLDAILLQHGQAW